MCAVVIYFYKCHHSKVTKNRSTSPDISTEFQYAIGPLRGLTLIYFVKSYFQFDETP